VVIVDPDAGVRGRVAESIAATATRVEQAESIEAARGLLASPDPDTVAVLDCGLLGSDVDARLEELWSCDDAPALVLLARERELATAIRAQRRWAAEVLLRDASLPAELPAALRRVRARWRWMAPFGDLDRLLEDMIDASPDALLLVDEQGRVRRGNRAAAELFEHPRAVLTELSVDELLPAGAREVHASHLSSWFDRPSQRPLRKGRTLHGQTRSGRRIPLQIGLGRVKAGRETLALVVLRDVTEREQLERELQHAQKLEAVGQLAGGVAHDFNNVLTGIQSFASFARDAIEEGHPAREDLDEVLHAVGRAEALTSQLLAFSRRQSAPPVVIDVADRIMALEKMLRRLVGEHIHLKIACEPDTGHMLIDPGQLDQVVMNLVVNARDAMPDGGSIEIHARSVDRLGPSPEVEVQVHDTGEGIEHDLVHRIFEPFFTTKAEGLGTGLGLSIVHGIVQQSGGQIDVDNRAGRGCTFTVRWPRHETRRTLSRPPPGLQHDPGGPLRVLLVEDAAPVREAVRRILTREGHDVSVASGPAEALVMAEAAPEGFDVLLTDVVMPVMSGPELAARIRRWGRARRVMYMTGYTDEDTSKHLAGSDDPVLLKPFAPTRLLEALRELMQ
jgi:PAS domain S-box-containing protein